MSKLSSDRVDNDDDSQRPTAQEPESVEETTETTGSPRWTGGVAAEDEMGELAESPSGGAVPVSHRGRWVRVLTYGVLPGLALLLAVAAGFLKWQDSSVRDADLARIGSVQAASNRTIALLSYKPNTVDQQLGAARDLLTGDFRDSYTSLTHDVVIPGAKQKQISAVATVPAAASVTAGLNHAVVLVFVNQTVIVGNGAPSDSASSVRVTLDKVGDHWLISGFEPV
jgi:Mce-associated membrane protein